MVEVDEILLMIGVDVVGIEDAVKDVGVIVVEVLDAMEVDDELLLLIFSVGVGISVVLLFTISSGEGN